MPGAVAATSLPGACQQGQTDTRQVQACPFTAGPMRPPWAPCGRVNSGPPWSPRCTQKRRFSLQPNALFRLSSRGGSSELNANSWRAPANWQRRERHSSVWERPWGRTPRRAWAPVLSREGRWARAPASRAGGAEASAPLGPAGGQPGRGLAMSRASGRRPECRAEKQGSAQSRLLGYKVPARPPWETLQHGWGSGEARALGRRGCHEGAPAAQGLFCSSFLFSSR